MHRGVQDWVQTVYRSPSDVEDVFVLTVQKMDCNSLALADLRYDHNARFGGNNIGFYKIRIDSSFQATC